MKNVLASAFTLLCISVMAQVPEICGNGVDDDLDGLVDCADPVCSCTGANAFPCSPTGELYQIASEAGGAAVLRNWNGTTWVGLNAWTNLLGPINAIGYNVQDGFIYGLRAASGVRNILVRVTAAGTVSVSTVPLLNPFGIGTTLSAYHTGDFDLNGNLYVTNRYINQMWRINVANNLTTAINLIDPNGLQIASQLADFAFLPNSQKFYGIVAFSSNPFILRSIDLGGNVRDFPIGGAAIDCANAAFGGAFADNSGNLYFYCNTNGSFARVTGSNNFNTWTATVLNATGDPYTDNDGAGCPLFDSEASGGDCCEQVLEILENWPPPTPSEGNRSMRVQSQLDAITKQLEDRQEKSSILHQNKPNPFDERTVITYEIKGESAQVASITIFNMNGVLINTYPIVIALNGELVIEAKTLQPGMYLYTMIVDDVEVDTKRMIFLE